MKKFILIAMLASLVSCRQPTSYSYGYFIPAKCATSVPPSPTPVASSEDSDEDDEHDVEVCDHRTKGRGKRIHKSDDHDRRHDTYVVTFGDEDHTELHSGRDL